MQKPEKPMIQVSISICGLNIIIIYIIYNKKDNVGGDIPEESGDKISSNVWVKSITDNG